MPDYYPKGAPSKTIYPYESGDVLVLGPEVFVSTDHRVINWRGENYYNTDGWLDQWDAQPHYNGHEPLT